jgi:hypothetical protein
VRQGDTAVSVPDSSGPAEAALRLDSSRTDLGPSAKSKDCASTFASALTSAFGRIDGTLLSVVAPQDKQCVWVNDDHLVLQVTVSGQVYRMVVNILSDRAGDQRVRLADVERPLPEPAWSEGWHAGAALDYVNSLSMHSTADFTPYEMYPLVAQVSDRLTLGAPISVYATSSGGSSAHKVHRNYTGQDGAIVIEPTGAKPRFLLFHFSEQTF